jgi:hypothetical protein
MYKIYYDHPTAEARFSTFTHLGRNDSSKSLASKKIHSVNPFPRKQSNFSIYQNGDRSQQEKPIKGRRIQSAANYRQKIVETQSDENVKIESEK